MRPVLALSLLWVSLAACSVNVTGAPCHADQNCPSGEYCVGGFCRDAPANDGSEDGGGDGGEESDGGLCDGGACSACDAGATPVELACCTTPGASECSGDTLFGCTADGGAPVWSRVEDCAMDNQQCRSPGEGAPPRCLCRPNTGGVFYADPDSGALPGAGDLPTGVEEPARCRFRRLGDALPTASGFEVRVPGGVGQFDQETFPLLIPAGTTLGGYCENDGGCSRLTLKRGGGGSPLVYLSPDSGLSRFELVNGEGSATAAALGCSSGEVTIDRVAILARNPAGARLSHGIRVEGSCKLSASEVRVSGASQVGVQLSAGTLSLDGGIVSDNGSEGISVTGGSAIVSNCFVYDNGSYGVSLDVGWNMSARISLIGNDIHGNSTSSFV